jgi:hypothetical protein
MKLAVSYELKGTGWATCVVADEAARIQITASYLSDALGSLVLAATGVLSGFRAVTFGFDEEPGEYRWVIRAIDLNEIEIRLLDFRSVLGNMPDDEGRLLFATRCRPAVFARAVHGAAAAVLEKHGEGGYWERWAEHPFPRLQLELLSRLLATPHNAA